MKKSILAIAVAALLAAGCVAPTPPANLTPADLKLQVQKACAVVQPTLLAVQATGQLDPIQQAGLDQIVAVNGTLCAAGASVDPTSIAQMVNTGIPAAIKAVSLLPLDPQTKTGVQIGLIAFQAALSAALVQYGPGPAAAAPAPSGVK